MEKRYEIRTEKEADSDYESEWLEQYDQCVQRKKVPVVIQRTIVHIKNNKFDCLHIL